MEVGGLGGSKFTLPNLKIIIRRNIVDWIVTVPDYEY